MAENLFNNGSDNMALIVTDPSAIAAAEAAKARIQSAYIMALQKPRNEATARDNILRACKRPDFASKAEYSKPVGGKKVKGASARFAEMALKEWGNALSEATIIYEDENIRRLKVSVTDLQTNTTQSVEISVSKTVERKSKKGREQDVIGERKNAYGQKVYILRATEDEMMTKAASWISKAKRNEGLRIIPTDIINEALATARQTVAAGINQDPEGAKKAIFDSFSSIGIRPAEVEKYLGHGADTVSPAELVDLRSVYQSIKDGEATWQEYVSDDKGKPPDKDHSEAFYKVFGDIQGRNMDQFLSDIATHNSSDINGVMGSALKDPDGFRAGYLKKYPRKQPGQPPRKSPQNTQEEPPPNIGDYPAQAGGTSSGPVWVQCESCGERVAQGDYQEHLVTCAKLAEVEKRRLDDGGRNAPNPDEITTPLDEKPGPWDMANWGRLRKGKPPKTGYFAYVLENLDALRDAPNKGLIAAMRQKWGKFYPETPFPVDNYPEPHTDTPPQEQASEWEGAGGTFHAGHTGQETPKSTAPTDPMFDCIAEELWVEPEVEKLVAWVSGDEFLTRLWKQHIAPNPINDMDRAEAVAMFLKERLKRQGTSLNDADTGMPER